MKPRNPQRDDCIVVLARHLTVSTIARLQWSHVRDRGLAGVDLELDRVTLHLTVAESEVIRKYGIRQRGSVVGLGPRGVRAVLDRRRSAASRRRSLPRASKACKSF